ncbi:MAG: hypothetical protein U9N34_08800 [Candidatus Cloacimonadota bacterium]|nr:hypothetical protein [Candidatus Cloacimonadota bacterium]
MKKILFFFLLISVSLMATDLKHYDKGMHNISVDGYTMGELASIDGIKQVSKWDSVISDWRHNLTGVTLPGSNQYSEDIYLNKEDTVWIVVDNTSGVDIVYKKQ